MASAIINDGRLTEIDLLLVPTAKAQEPKLREPLQSFVESVRQKGKPNALDLIRLSISGAN